jgi:hypothetical protein
MTVLLGCPLPVAPGKVTERNAYATVNFAAGRADRLRPPSLHAVIS